MCEVWTMASALTTFSKVDVSNLEIEDDEEGAPPGGNMDGMGGMGGMGGMM